MNARSGTQQTAAQRRARGLYRLTLWIPEEYRARLDALCEDSGYGRTDIMLGMIDAEWDDMQMRKADK